MNNMYSPDVFQIALDKRSINRFLLLCNIGLVKHLVISLLLFQYWATSQTGLSVGYLISSLLDRAGDHYLISNLCLINPIVYKDWQSNWTENTPLFTFICQYYWHVYWFELSLILYIFTQQKNSLLLLTYAMISYAHRKWLSKKSRSSKLVLSP